MGKVSDLMAQPFWELHDQERSKGRVCQVEGQLAQRPKDVKKKLNRLSRKTWGWRGQGGRGDRDLAQGEVERDRDGSRHTE